MASKDIKTDNPGCLIAFSLPFILIGVLIVLGSGSTLYDMYKTSSDGEEIEAEVVEIRVRQELATGRYRGGGDVTRYYPMLQYEVNGETYMLEGDRDVGKQMANEINSSATNEAISDEPVYETVIYDPLDPSDAVMKYTVWDWIGTIFTASVFGLLFLGGGLLVSATALLRR